MATDYKVQRRTYDDVAMSATNLRIRLGIEHCFSFNIVHQIRRMKGKEFGELGSLDIHLFTGHGVPYVTFDPLVLHVDKEIWDEAELNEPMARFMLAHELGHLVLHRYYRQEFSASNEQHLKAFPAEERSEPQANWFAATFLAPDYLAIRCQNASELCMSFDYPREFAGLKQHLFQQWQGKNSIATPAP